MSASDTRQGGSPPQDQEHGEAADARHSGEGAASALAQLKTQTKQHRRQSGESEDPAGGPGQ